MKTSNTILIFGILIIIIVFLLYRFKDKIVETFSNPISLPTMIEDNKKMNIVILSFFYSDTCPASREFLYGCCRDIEGDREQIEEKLHQYQQKGDEITDSYGNKLRNWYSENENNNFIINSQEVSTKCKSINKV